MPSSQVHRALLSGDQQADHAGSQRHGEYAGARDHQPAGHAVRDLNLGHVAAINGHLPAAEELQINGHRAAYIQGGHLLVVQGFHQAGVLVAGPALIWEGGNGLTYRLESDRPLDQLIRIAESIQ